VNVCSSEQNRIGTVGRPAGIVAASDTSSIGYQQHRIPAEEAIVTVPGSVIAGRYRLVAQIAAGGMGSVWEAADQLLQRTVAIKQLLPQAGLDDDELAMANSRVIREARITARLHHPHAVTLYDVVEHDSRPCLIMQFVPSKSLDALLRERGPFEVPFVARIGAEVASALAAAHRVGIVHRDVKPGNVLITPEGSANITDFGISHAVGDVSLTSTGMLTGTPAYLAPEVARGTESSFSADVFSLGATLYAALEGTPPFGNDMNPMAVLHRVASGQLIPPRRSGMLAPLLLHMLAPEPKYRPAMSDVALRLSEAAAEQPAPAPAPQPRQPTLVGFVAEPQREPQTLEEQQGTASRASVFGTGGLLPIGQPAASPVAARNRKIRPLAATIGAVLVAAIVLATALFLGRDRETTATPPIKSEQPALISSGAASSEAASVPATVAVGPEAVPPPGSADSAVPSAQSSAAPSTTVAATAVATKTVATKTVATNTVATRTAATKSVAGQAPGAATIGTTAAKSPTSTAQPAKSSSTRPTSTSSKPTPVARTTTSATATSASTTRTSATESGTSTTAASTSATSTRASTTATSAEGRPTASELSSALTGYYDLLPNDTAAGWDLLTANFQNGIAHDRDYYQNYWDGVESVSISQVDAQPPNTVVATISYRFTTGKTSVERTQYDLVRQDGVLKINNSSVIG